MKNKIAILVTLLFGCLQAAGQPGDWEWVSAAGGSSNEYGSAIAVDAAGNTYVTGSFLSPTVTFGHLVLTNASRQGTNDIFLVKYDATGQVCWAKSMGGTADDYASGMVMDKQGRIYLAGYCSGSGISFRGLEVTPPRSAETEYQVEMKYYFAMACDSSGKSFWISSAPGAPRISDIAVDILGNCYLTGSYSKEIIFGSTRLTSAAGNREDIFVVKYNATGQIVWARSAGGAKDDYGTSLATDVLGNVYVTGSFYSPVVVFDQLQLGLKEPGKFHNDVFLVKYDTAGIPAWVKSLGTGDDAHSSDIALDKKGNIYLAGSFDRLAFARELLLENKGSDDLFLMKLTGSGNLLWAKSAGGNGLEAARGLVVDVGGNAYITGYFRSSELDFGELQLGNTGNGDVFIVKYSSKGRPVWAKSISGTSDVISNAIALDEKGNVYITGLFNETTVAGTFQLISKHMQDAFTAKLSGTKK